MSWEALTAIGTLVTAMIIGVTAVVAVYQIRHLRAATQLESYLDLMREATSAEMAAWTDYVETVLPRQMQDEAYRRELSDGRVDFKTHRELSLGAFWEKIGALVHYKLIESDALIDFVAEVCPYHWTLLRDVAVLRRERNPMIWERFEELAQICEQHMRGRGVLPPSERPRPTGLAMSRRLPE